MFFCFLLPLSRVGSSQEVVQKLLAKTYLCTLLTLVHVWAIRSLLQHTEEVLVSQIIFQCCWHFIKQPSKLWVLFCVHAYRLNWDSLESILKTSKFGQSKIIFFLLDLISLECILLHTPNVSVSIYWKKFAICLVFTYLLLGQTLICLPGLLGYDTNYRSISI